MRTVKMTAWLAIGFLVLTVAGCARPDWIEQTLVTVDVTGVWRGSDQIGTQIQLTLQQNGPKVTGRITTNDFRHGDTGGLIEGTVTGDIFRFHDARGSLTAELQVNGDEMTGLARFPSPGSITLRRQQ